MMNQSCCPDPSTKYVWDIDPADNGNIVACYRPAVSGQRGDMNTGIVLCHDASDDSYVIEYDRRAIGSGHGKITVEEAIRMKYDWLRREEQQRQRDRGYTPVELPDEYYS